MIGQIINAKAFSPKMKATIYRTGSLRFNVYAIKQLQINETKAIILAPDTQEKNVLYMAAVDAKSNDNAFQICKSGLHFYINTKQLFDHMELNYTKNIIFELSRCDKYDDAIGGECYKMTPRSKNRN